MTKPVSPLAPLLRRLADGRNLSGAEAEAMMWAFIDGAFSPVELGCAMMGLRLKGETAEELTGMVRACRAAAAAVATPPALEVVDLCGTGGDGPGAGVFNISTTAMFVAAGAGAPITKHGTGAVSSQSGSSDVLQALGARNLDDPQQVAACLAATGLAFLHGPAFNPGMRNVVQARRQAGIRSFFNLIGPMSNPAAPLRQVIGLYDRRYTEVVAQTLGSLGSRHVMVVAAHNGLDEISTEGLTQISEFRDGRLTTTQFDPTPFGFAPLDWTALSGGDPAFNAAKTRAILVGQLIGCAREIVLLNASAALVVGALAQTLAEGLILASESLDSGRALAKLEAYRTWTSGA